MSRVLVADDEPAVLEVLSEVVEELGHEVVRAHDGREALMLARAQLPNLVVTDHMMPRLSGLELCREMRADDQLREVPVILLSAALPREAHEANACLAKPFELGEFERIVKQTLDFRALADPSLFDRPLVPSVDELMELVVRGVGTPVGEARHALLEARSRLDAPPELTSLLDRAIRELDLVDHAMNGIACSTDLGSGRVRVEPRRMDLKRFIEGMAAEWRELHNGVPLEVRLPLENVFLRFDPERLRRILDELISNAVFHGGGKGIEVDVSATAHVASIRITDSGPGISASEQRNLFQRFRRDRSGRMILGSGLYVASQLAKLLGGLLVARSAPDGGAELTVTLPRTI